MTLDWPRYRMVVFDMDGTLYDQRKVRRAIGADLLAAALRSCDWRLIATIRTYRRIVEVQAEAEPPGSLDDCVRLTADMCGFDAVIVRATIDEWMHRRPLAFLRKYRARGVEHVFAALHATGRQIGVWSDYPVDDKLAALDLRADTSVWSGDGAVDRMKPDPAGLAHLLRVTGTDPEHTLMIGDRFDRDWRAATKLGVRTIIRARRTDPRAPTFRCYEDAMFAPLLEELA